MYDIIIIYVNEVIVLFKKVIKLTPTNIYNTSIIESWLSDMSEKGLLLSSIGSTYSVFTKGEAKRLSYRVIIEKVSDESLLAIKDEFSDSGWNFVATGANSVIIFSHPNEFISSNSYPNLNSKVEEIKKVYKSRLFNSFFSFLLAIFILTLPSISFNFEPFLYLINIINIQLFAFIYIFLLFLKNLGEVITLKKLLKNSNSNVFKTNNTSWKSKRTVAIFLETLSWLLIILGVMTLINPPYKELELSKYEDKSIIPVVTMDDITGSNISIEEYKTSYNSTTTYQSSILSPKKYKNIELSNKNSAFLYSDSYLLAFDALAKPLVNTLASNYKDNFKPSDKPLNLNNDFFDNLIVYNYNDTYNIFSSKDNAVITLAYSSSEDINILLEVLKNKFQILKDSSI